MKVIIVSVLLATAPISAQVPVLTAAGIEVRGERAKFVDCAKLFAYDHAKEYPDPGLFFDMAMMRACNSYLEKFVSLALAMPEFTAVAGDQRAAIANLQLADAVADAKAAAVAAYREVRAQK